MNNKTWPLSPRQQSHNYPPPIATSIRN